MMKITIETKYLPLAVFQVYYDVNVGHEKRKGVYLN